MLNLGQRRFWCEDLGEGEITDLIDDAGDFTDDPDEAVVAIVTYGPSCWLQVRVRDYVAQARH